MINTTISDGKGLGYKAQVDMFGSLQTHQGPFRPDDKSYIVPFTQFFTLDGTSAGSSEMAITTGTPAAPVKFFIPASLTRERFITSLGFFISGAAASLDEFGTGTALTNGCRLLYSGGISGDAVIAAALKSNFEFVRLCDGQPAFGSGSQTFQITNAIGTAEAFIPQLDVRVIAPPYGLKLDKATTQRIVMEIRDDTLTNRAVNFNIFAKGFEVL